MRGKLASALWGPFCLQALAAVLLSLWLVLSLLSGFGLGLLAVVRPELGTGPYLAPVLMLLVPTFWALARAWNSANFMWAFGRWPPLKATDYQEAERPWLEAAAHAFDQAEFASALQILDRLNPDALKGSVRLVRGRTLLWNGRWDEGVAELEQGGERRYIVGWLKPRRFFGLTIWSLGPADSARAQRSWVAWLTLTGVSACTLALLVPAWTSVRVALSAPAKSFDVSGFDTMGRGRFVAHFHDPLFAAMVLDLADDALDHDLEFMARPPDTFKGQEIQFFLCDDQAEYLKRSPYPSAWEAGCAVPDRCSIFLYKPRTEGTVYFQVTVAHELSHLIYQRMGIHGRNDSWLNEGLANYLGYKFAFDRNNIPRQAWLQEHEFSRLRGNFIPFGRFFSMEPHQLSREEDVGTFYEQGSSVVYLLIEEYGRESFLKFLKTYSDGATVDRALAENYPSLPDLEALAAVWGLFFNDAATVPSQASFAR